MFAFEIWGGFASFRDPFTISQNISLAIPPKTTVAGMMASILGVEEYFEDDAFSTFEYSVVVLNPIAKKSFSQNYINDYTDKTQKQINNMKKLDFHKVGEGLRDKKDPQKPINRELLLNPKYLIIIKNFKYEEKLTIYLKEKMSKFPFYLGNSEFAGNFSFKEVISSSVENMKSIKVDSFILESDINQVDFEEGIRYSTISFATVLNKERSPINASSVVLGSKAISVKDMEVDKIVCQDDVYHCRFI